MRRAGRYIDRDCCAARNVFDSRQAMRSCYIFNQQYCLMVEENYEKYSQVSSEKGGEYAVCSCSLRLT